MAIRPSRSSKDRVEELSTWAPVQVSRLLAACWPPDIVTLATVATLATGRAPTWARPCSQVVSPVPYPSTLGRAALKPVRRGSEQVQRE